MSKKLVRRILGLVLMMALFGYPGAKRLAAGLTEVAQIAWSKIGGQVQSLESAEEREEREAQLLLEKLEPMGRSAVEAAATARVERDQAVRDCKALEAELATHIEVARTISSAIKQGEATHAGEVTLPGVAGNAATPMRVTLEKARGALAKAQKVYEGLKARVSLSQDWIKRSTALAAEWEVRCQTLDMQTAEVRQGLEVLRLYRTDAGLRAGCGSLTRPPGLEDELTAGLEKLRKRLAVGAEQRGLARSDATGGGHDVYENLIDQRKAEKAASQFTAELEQVK